MKENAMAGYKHDGLVEQKRKTNVFWENTPTRNKAWQT